MLSGQKRIKPWLRAGTGEAPSMFTLEKHRRLLKPTFILAGGLGNQLFIVAAALAYSISTGSEVLFSSEEVRKSDKERGASLKQFGFKGKSDIRFIGLANRQMRFLLARFAGLVGKSLTHGSADIGFDPQLLSAHDALLIRGHFQTYRYLELPSVDDFFKGIYAVNPSPPFTSLVEEFRRTPTLAIHIRLGDYKSLSESFGLLSARYYEGAARQAMNNPLVEIRNVFVFTDDADGVRDYVKLLDLGLPIRILGRHSGLSDAESLLLMSEAQSLVIANSTFSWWAGMLGNKKKTVIAPNKWFRNLKDPDELYPPAWHLMESDWIK